MQILLRNLFIITLFAAYALSFHSCATADQVWQDITSNLSDVRITAIAIDPSSPDHIYLGTEKGIFKTENSGKYWRRVLTVKGNSTKVNSLAILPGNPNCIYAATQSGLFISADRGENWKKLLQGIDQLQKDVTTVLPGSQGRNMIFAGTKSGLLTSSDNGQSWKNLSMEGLKVKINHIISKDNSIFVASEAGIFQSDDNGNNWLTLFNSPASEIQAYSDEEQENYAPDENTHASARIPNCLAVNSEYLYAGTNSGVYAKLHKAAEWKKLTSSGLIDDRITSLVVLDNMLYAGTQNGVFKLYGSDKNWIECYKGIISKKISLITHGPDNTIFAATENGIYQLRASSPGIYEDAELKQILSRFDSEPSINEVLEAATRYAEVNSEKITQWRKAAKRKALLPDLSIGVDHDIKDTYEIYTSSTTNYWTTGPANTSTGWDVTLNWDLGDLIWNDDQTSIDVRSKLMVQLRDDILNEVTRLYFERRRLQIGLLLNPPKELNDKIEKNLRLQELTAGIDALTGGWFSRQLIK